jgi:pyrimidine-nucleoside phosphorylase
MVLGAGRITKESELDFTAGITLFKKTGDQVTVGDTLARLFSNSDSVFEDAAQILQKAYTIGNDKPEEEVLILGRVTK